MNKRVESGTAAEYIFQMYSLLFCKPHWPWCAFIADTSLLFQSFATTRCNAAQSQKIFSLVFH